MILKQGSADILINAVREVIHQNLQSLIQLICLLASFDGLDVQVDEPVERILVHGVDVGEFGTAEEQNGGMFGHGDVHHAGIVDFLLGATERLE